MTHWCACVSFFFYCSFFQNFSSPLMVICDSSATNKLATLPVLSHRFLESFVCSLETWQGNDACPPCESEGPGSPESVRPCAPAALGSKREGRELVRTCCCSAGRASTLSGPSPTLHRLPLTFQSSRECPVLRPGSPRPPSRLPFPSLVLCLSQSVLLKRTPREH